MSRFLIVISLLMSSLSISAQTIDDVIDLMDKKDFTGAKTQIDKYLTNPKNSEKADGWYIKGRVYNAVSYDGNLAPEQLYQLKSDALAAFTKNYLMDEKHVRFQLEGPAFISFLDLYYGFYDLGAKFFNAKNYENSLLSFKKALELKDFMIAEKFDFGNTKLPALDTALIVNAATAAAQANKEELAEQYFKMITDANINGSDYVSVYEYLADYYSKGGNDEALRSILKKAREFYPANSFWDQIELGMAEKSGSDEALQAKYEERIAANPSGYALKYDYSVWMYNKIYASDEKLPNQAEMQAKLTNTLREAVKLAKGPEAGFLMATHLYNMCSDYSTAAVAIKGNKPDDLKKKKELNALTDQTMNEFLQYAEAYVKQMEEEKDLKASQKANTRSMCDNIIDVFNMKKDSKKAAEYEKKKDKFQ
jgi:hypothetical protein